MPSAAEENPELGLPPLSLYVHLPWCVRKCPYCDFNSHAAGDDFPADDYAQAVIRDLEQELPLVWGRVVNSIYFGGGTPSLFSAARIEEMLSGFRRLLTVSPAAEISLEANPGTTEHDSFSAYRDAGINRFSLGIQSFNDRLLTAIGRIHGRREAERAVEAVHASGIRNFNIDLMFALPGQLMDEAVADLESAIDCGPAHISHYQLTIEPNTAFHAAPPRLPEDDEAWEMQREGGRLLSDAGYAQYEISAWSRKENECRHNLNYWRYGDFIGVGAGAHGKITLPQEQVVRRRIRHRHPKQWMKAVADGNGIADDRALGSEERVFEFFLNQLRLRSGVVKSQFPGRTGVAWSEVSGRVGQAVQRELLIEDGGRLLPTSLGWRFNNETQAIFLP